MKKEPQGKCIFTCLLTRNVYSRLTHLSLSLSLSYLHTHSPEEDPAVRQFGEEVANEENLFAELQVASGVDQIITENEKLVTEK